MFRLNKDDVRNAILESNNNLLIMGGPGSGKTTIALFKAKQIIDSGILKSSQKILFLSFARATISRVEEQTKNIISAEIKKQIEINTYHGFLWNILKHHGYLLSKYPTQIFLPHDAASRLSGVKKSDIPNKLEEIFINEGLIHFDLFAKLVNKLFAQSNSLKKIVANMYPIIILDEFQDTNIDEWNMVNLLGKYIRIIALADPEQRIYDFRGADPKRITQYIEQYSPDVFDFGNENNRSNGTDIVKYGNDLLLKINKDKEYNDVSIQKIPYLKSPLTHAYAKLAVLQSIERLKKDSTSSWSVAVLVPTNSLMLEVSNMFQQKQQLKNGKVFPAIKHDVSIEVAGPSLAAKFIGCIIDKGSTKKCSVNIILEVLMSHILGRRGAKDITKKDAEIATFIREYILTGKARGKNRIKLIEECTKIATSVNETTFTGNIIKDWKFVLTIIGECESEYIVQIAKDAKYIRLLQKGNQLYSSIDKIWRKNKNYNGIENAVAEALTQEHFAMSTKKWDGVNVMTIHKSKGKEFDEVIIYEGFYNNRIVSKPEYIEQSRLNLRVAVTRAKKHAVIITPENDPCPLL